MGIVKLVTGIFLGVAILAFKNQAPIAGVYFSVLTAMGVATLFLTYKRERNIDNPKEGK